MRLVRLETGAVALLALGAGCAATNAGRSATDPDPAAAVDVLVFAPHPDDEVLNCAGVLQQAITQGRRVTVVVLTNGDGFTKAAAALVGKPAVALTPDDYLKLASVRQQMSIDSMALIGGRRADLIFLGYPNGGLDEMFKRDGDRPLTSPETRRSKTYGPIVADHHTAVHGQPAPYLRAAVIDDIVGVLQRTRPREIYVTHEADSHPDHRAAFWFVRAAAVAAGVPGPLFTYVGHGDSKPPLPVRQVPLTPEQRSRKQAAIKEHRLPVVHDTLGDEVSDRETFWIYDLK